MALSDLEVRQQAERSERGADLVAVRQDLDRQWEELSKGLAQAMNDTDTRAQKARAMHLLSETKIHTYIHIYTYI